MDVPESRNRKQKPKTETKNNKKKYEENLYMRNGGTFNRRKAP